MEPRPSFLTDPDHVDQDPEEPLEVPDYYEAIEAEWLRSDTDDNDDQGLNPVDPPRK